MTARNRSRHFIATTLTALLFLLLSPTAFASEGGSLDATIDSIVKPMADLADGIVFYAIGGFPVVLILLAGTAVFLTIYFRFINLRGFKTALNTVKGKYTDPDAPGQITHFQALSAALSATVGLGNIAGVAVAIGIGGPGATFWMILIGLCGMTTKFTECTLGVLYRKIAADGSTRGGPMYYLRDGLAEKGMAGLGKVLAIFFAIMCVAGAIGAGNMFQANQAYEQIHQSFGIFEHGWQFGLVVAFMVALVIIGGIVAIARVTSFLVPFMCGMYLIAAFTVLIVNASHIPGAIAIIFREAFNFGSAGGAAVGVVLIQGIKRGVFSNEAGVGSAPIAHSAVKTNRPASEGLVALLEPFIDTVVVCTMTALVIVTSGMWDVKADVAESGAVVYSSADPASERVGTLEGGEKLRFAGADARAQDSWYEVATPDGEVSGWVRNDQLTPLSFTSAEADLKAEPSADAETVATIDAGDQFDFIGLPPANLLGNRQDGWYQVALRDGKSKGWVETSSLPKVTTAEAVELLKGVDPEKKTTGLLEAGTVVTFTGGVTAGWYQVSSFDGSKTGWVDALTINLQNNGIWLTSAAFATVIGWFPYVLAIAVFLFAFSTMISWSYYAEQAVIFLFGDKKAVVIAYKLMFCGFIVVGAAASLGNVIKLADALFFCMVIPNLIGVYILLPRVKQQLTSYLEHVRSVDGQGK